MTPKAKEQDLNFLESERDSGLPEEQSESTVYLDRISKLVLDNCDGINSPWEIQRLLNAKHGIKVNEDTMWFALTRLKRLDLLESDTDDSIERYAALLESEALTGSSHKTRLSMMLLRVMSVFSWRREQVARTDELYNRGAQF